MVTQETHQINWYAICVMLLSVATLIFLIFVAIYSADVAKLKIPGAGTSTFILVFSIILAIFFLVLFIYSIYKVVSHKVPVAETKTVYVKVPEQKSSSIPTKATVVTTPAKPLISNVPTTKALKSDVSLSLSSLTGTAVEKQEEDQLALGSLAAMMD